MKTSDEEGDLALKLDIPGHLDGVGVFAIRAGRGRPLVGLFNVSREQIGKPITIVMHPACRILLQIESQGLHALEKKFNAQLTGRGWWRAAYVGLGRGTTAPHRSLPAREPALSSSCSPPVSSRSGLTAAT